MLEYLAVVLMAAGAFLLIQGLRERYPEYEFPSSWEVHDRQKEAVIDDNGSEKRSGVRGGGVVLIGPIPIVFGDSKYAVAALILTIFLMLLALAFMVVI